MIAGVTVASAIEQKQKEHGRSGDAREVIRDTVDDENNVEHRQEHICDICKFNR